MAKHLETSIRFKKAENGFIITVNTESTDAKGNFKFSSKQFIATSARDAKKIMDEQTKLIK